MHGIGTEPPDRREQHRQASQGEQKGSEVGSLHVH